MARLTNESVSAGAVAVLASSRREALLERW